MTKQKFIVGFLVLASYSALADDWVKEIKTDRRVDITSSKQVNDRGEGKVRLTLRRQSSSASTESCDLSIAFTNEKLNEPLDALPKSKFTRCQLSSSLGSKTYDCHVQTIASRALQSITLDKTADGDHYIFDSLMFTKAISVSSFVSGASTYQLNGVRPILKGLYSWCRGTDSL